jgi:hypothetical protein
MKAKTLDCIEMKRRGSQRIYEATKDLTLEQEVAYWCERSRQFRQEQEQIAAKAATTTAIYDARS